MVTPHAVEIISGHLSHNNDYPWSPHSSRSTMSPVVTPQYGDSIWLHVRLVTHACKGVSDTVYFFMTSFRGLEIGYGEQRKLLSFIIYNV